MEYLDFKWEFGEEKVYITVSQYMNGNIYIGLGPDFSDVTKNIIPLRNFEGAVNTPNLKELREFLVKNKIGVDTGRTVSSGYNIYPIFKFSRKRLAELNSKELQIYLDNC